MADCVSLPNAAGLVMLLKNEEYFWREDDYKIRNPHADIAKAAADAIEQLVSKCNQLATENAKLKAERDAAVADLRSLAPCRYCKHFGVNPLTCDALEECLYGKEQTWEWRGMQKEEE